MPKTKTAAAHAKKSTRVAKAAKAAKGVSKKSKTIKKTAPANGGIKKRKNKAGTLALREVKKY